MANVIQKDALYSGRWRLRDGRVFEVKPEDIPWYEQRMKEFHENRLPIPMTWEHQPHVKPGSPEAIADHARLCLGHTVDVSSKAGVLEIKADVPNDEDRKKLPAIKYVSPYIEYDYVDQTGKLWPGPSITHVAVTANPVQNLQRPFALSQSRDPLAVWDGGVALAFDPKMKVKDDDDNEDDENPADDAREDDGEGDDSPGEDVEAQTPPDDSYEDDGAQPEEQDSLFGDDGDADNDATPAGDTGQDAAAKDDEDLSSASPSKMSRVVDLLHQHAGLSLPKDTDGSNFLDRLETALLTLRRQNPDYDSPNSGTDQYGMDSQPREANPPVVMSQNPSKTASKGSIPMSQNIVNVLQARLLEADRKDLLARVNKLYRTARIDQKTHGKLTGELKAVKLSLHPETGTVQAGDILIRIKAYEELPEGMFGVKPDGEVNEVPLSLDGGATEAEKPEDRQKRLSQISALMAGRNGTAAVA